MSLMTVLEETDSGPVATLIGYSLFPPMSNTQF